MGAEGSLDGPGEEPNAAHHWERSAGKLRAVNKLDNRSASFKHRWPNEGSTANLWGQQQDEDARRTPSHFTMKSLVLGSESNRALSPKQKQRIQT